jgi:hypothetical protein
MRYLAEKSPGKLILYLLLEAYVRRSQSYPDRLLAAAEYIHKGACF